MLKCVYTSTACVSPLLIGCLRRAIYLFVTSLLEKLPQSPIARVCQPLTHSLHKLCGGKWPSHWTHAVRFGASALTDAVGFGVSPKKSHASQSMKANWKHWKKALSLLGRDDLCGCKSRSTQNRYSTLGFWACSHQLIKGSKLSNRGGARRGIVEGSFPLNFDSFHMLLVVFSIIIDFAP